MQNKIIIIMGKKGCGKSYLSNLLILERSVDKRVFIYDTLNEYDYPTVNFDTFDSTNKGIFKISPIDCEDEKQLFSTTCEWIYKIGNTVFVVDEIDMYCSPQSQVEYLTKICRYGRHKQIDLIAITRRPHDLPRTITAMADEFYIFKIQEPRDIAYLKNFSHDIEQKINSLTLDDVHGYTSYVKIIP